MSEITAYAGDLINTEDMTIAENLDRIINAKSAIRDAITAKGGQVSEDARIDQYPAAIEALPSGDEKFKTFMTSGIDENNDIIFPQDIRTIRNCALSGIPTIRNCNIPEGVTDIGKSLFNPNAWITIDNLTIPSTTTTIGSYFLNSSTYQADVKNLYFNAKNCVLETGGGTGGGFMLGLTYVGNYYIGDNVTRLDSYFGCSRPLTGYPRNGKIGLKNSGAYIELPNSLTSMYANFSDFSSAGKNDWVTEVEIPSNITTMPSCFMNQTKLTKFISNPLVPPTINTETFNKAPSTMEIYVHLSALEAYQSASNWSKRAAYIIPIEQPKNIILTSYNPVTIKSFTKNFNVECVFELEAEDGTKFNSNKTYKLTTDENLGDEPVSKNFDIEFLGFNFTITITQTANDPKTITNVENYGTYGFNLNNNGYYESNNKGKSSSFAYATVTFVPQSDSVTFECINSGESNYDYGIISQLNKELTKTATGDTSTTLVKKSFKGLSSLNPVDVVYDGLSVGETYTITVKFIKDSGGDQGNDSFQFKVKGE